MPTRQSSSEMSQMGMEPCPRTMPALLKRTSTLPNSSIARRNRFWTWAESVTSVETAIARLPCARTASAASWMGAMRRDAMTRSAPARAIAMDISRPRPVPPPVMTMVLLWRERDCSMVRGTPGGDGLDLVLLQVVC